MNDPLVNLLDCYHLSGFDVQPTKDNPIGSFAKRVPKLLQKVGDERIPIEKKEGVNATARLSLSLSRALFFQINLRRCP